MIRFSIIMIIFITIAYIEYKAEKEYDKKYDSGEIYYLSDNDDDDDDDDDCDFDFDFDFD